MFIACYDTSGNYLSAIPLPSGGDDYSGLVEDSNQNFYLFGDFMQLNNFTLGTDTLHIGNGGENLFISKFDYNIYGGTPAPSFTHTGVLTDTFTYTGTNYYDSLRWSFGDGSVSSAIDPFHTYTAAGVYYVCVDAYSHCLPIEKPYMYYCRNVNANDDIPVISEPDGVMVCPTPVNRKNNCNGTLQNKKCQHLEHAWPVCL